MVMQGQVNDYLLLCIQGSGEKCSTLQDELSFFLKKSCNEQSAGNKLC